jgi:hypothetical protein
MFLQQLCVKVHSWYGLGTQQAHNAAAVAVKRCWYPSSSKLLMGEGPNLLTVVW